MQIREQILTQIKSNLAFQGAIAMKVKCSPLTVGRWAQNEGKQLLHLDTLAAICEYTKLPITEVVDQFPAAEFQVKPVTEKEAA